ncbi:ELKS/Rab6-interacting/CAST family member 1 [Lates japonicus]|uniref:ELKS/Rab6-interacting/CAST family member 1 n=1 Tax=Lates japonicus TaxID=270547 RepID=A0AAD3NP93_LATJO|nr:ELKS/Rab6-interacting/CAST family member 1 [Lates japonicus]
MCMQMIAFCFLYLSSYIAHLTDLCHGRDPSHPPASSIPSHYHHSDPGAGRRSSEDECRTVGQGWRCVRRRRELQECANSVLQQIADYCPDILGRLSMPWRSHAGVSDLKHKLAVLGFTLTCS